MVDAQFRIQWFDRGREPQCPPNPAFPAGVDIDSGKRPACHVKLEPYPAPRCGFLYLECQRCGTHAIITTAGRPDDPRSVQLPCIRH